MSGFIFQQSPQSLPQQDMVVHQQATNFLIAENFFACDLRREDTLGNSYIMAREDLRCSGGSARTQTEYGVASIVTARRRLLPR